MRREVQRRLVLPIYSFQSTQKVLEPFGGIYRQLSSNDDYFLCDPARQISSEYLRQQPYASIGAAHSVQRFAVDGTDSAAIKRRKSVRYVPLQVPCDHPYTMQSTSRRETVKENV